MPDKEQIIDVVHLGDKTFTFTLPKKIRELLKLDENPHILYFIEEPNGTVSISLGGKNVLATSEFFSSNQITLRKRVRERLELQKGDSIIFYLNNEGKIILRKQ